MSPSSPRESHSSILSLLRLERLFMLSFAALRLVQEVRPRFFGTGSRVPMDCGQPLGYQTGDVRA
jgi:hypothetical protein